MQDLKQDQVEWIKPMEPAGRSLDLIRAMLEQLAQDSEPIQESSDFCSICSNTKQMLIDDPRGSYRGRIQKVAVPCVCTQERRIRQQMETVPVIYRQASLETVKPQPHIHAAQPRAVQLISDHPEKNFHFVGDVGTGKTHLFYCLHNQAVRKTGFVYANTLQGLVSEYQSCISRSMAGELNVKAKITGEDLRQTRVRWSLFLDDIDKAKPTEYVAQQLFDLIDACINYRHQLCWTSNLTADQLSDHFSRASDRFGRAIVRRLLENSEPVEMW